MEESVSLRSAALGDGLGVPGGTVHDSRGCHWLHNGARAVGDGLMNN
jgi:hypothetical protein